MVDGVKEVLSNVIGIPIIQIDESISMATEKKWDSLKHMAIVLALEERFAVRFTMDQIVEMTRFDAIIKVLQSNLE